VPWKVAQVLAIYREGVAHENDTLNEKRIQLRWFYRSSDDEVLQVATSKTIVDAVYSSNDIVDVSCTKIGLLGPLVLFPGSEVGRDSFSNSAIWKSIVPFMPAIAVTYMGHFDGIKKRIAVPPHDVVVSGINISDHYDGETKNILLRALRHDVPDDVTIDLDHSSPEEQVIDENQNPNVFLDTGNDESSTKVDSSLSNGRQKNGQGRTKAWTAIPPFYTNRANDTEYFSQIEVLPPFDSYATESADSNDAKNRTWTIKLGDPVIVHHDMCAGRASYHASTDERIKVLSSMNSYFPFTVPWAVAEIVHIMRHLESNQITLEIRWFYRMSEISSKAIKAKRKNDLDCEEICESDHYDVIEPLNILAPAHLYEAAQMIKIGNRFNGMPVVEFHCNRFWSVYRKSLKPIGGLSGRIERGRLQSESIANDQSLKAALFGATTTHPCSSPTHAGEALSFHDAFTRVIHKLSLTDASKEAYDNSSALIGRESERREISAFLRSSINGNGQGSSIRASLFIAGPPGTGKTAVSFAISYRYSTIFLHVLTITYRMSSASCP
jgi:hypothetical protein